MEKTNIKNESAYLNVFIEKEIINKIKAIGKIEKVRLTEIVSCALNHYITDYNNKKV